MIAQTLAALALAGALGGNAGLGSGTTALNSGNAGLTSGAAVADSGKTILEATRAHLEAPRDPAIGAELQAARAQAGVAAPEMGALDALVLELSPAEWAWLAMGAFWASAVAVALAIASGKKRLLVAAGSAAALGLVALAANFSVARKLDDAVVIAKDGAPLLLSPFDTAQSEATLLPGEEVVPLARSGGYLRVRDGRGQIGWLQSSTVEALVPPNA